MEAAIGEILKTGMPGAMIVVLLLAVVRLHDQLQKSHAQLLLQQEKMYGNLSAQSAALEAHTAVIQRQTEAMDSLARSSDATTHALRALEVQTRSLENSVSTMRGRVS